MCTYFQIDRQTLQFLEDKMVLQCFGSLKFWYFSMLVFRYFYTLIFRYLILRYFSTSILRYFDASILRCFYASTFRYFPIFILLSSIYTSSWINMSVQLNHKHSVVPRIGSFLPVDHLDPRVHVPSRSMFEPHSRITGGAFVNRGPGLTSSGGTRGRCCVATSLRNVPAD